MSEANASNEWLTPGPEVEGEPYWAIMDLDEEGNTTANIWSHMGRITLFKTKNLAERILGVLNKREAHPDYAVRGVTERHLSALEDIGAQSEVDLMVVIRIDDGGTVEARPLGQEDD